MAENPKELKSFQVKAINYPKGFTVGLVDWKKRDLFLKLIDNPDPRVKNIDTSDWTDQDWINYTKDWNYYVSNIIELERECEYMFKVLEKSNIVKQIDEREIFNYDNDTYAHTETYGRWRFTKKALKRHKLKHAKK